MQFLPVVQRELLVAARKRSTYLSRTATAGVLLIFFAVVFVSESGKRAGFPGLMLWVLSSIVFLEAMLAGVRYTSDCLSEERREGTLGLLFLTSLNGFDIVSGKVIGRAAGAVFNLLAAIPILALTILAGGVTGQQIAALGITFLVAAFFSLSLGTFVSSRGYAERTVLLRTLLLLVIISFLPLLIKDFAGWILNQRGPLLYIQLNSRWEAIFEQIQSVRHLSPFYAFLQAQSGFRPDVAPTLWTVTMMACALFGYASWRIQRSFGEADVVAPSTSRTGSRTISPSRDCPEFNSNPVQWLASRGRSHWLPAIGLFVLFIVFGLVCRICLEKGWNWVRFVLVFGTLGFHWLYKFIITAETCRQLNHDARSGALEILLTTPAPADEIVRAPITATRRTWLFVGVALGLMNCIWMMEESFLRDLWILLPVSIGLIAFDSYALAWQAVLNAVRGDRYGVTVFKTFFRVMTVPLAIAVLFIIIGMGSTMNDEMLAAFFGTWGALCAAYDCWIIAHSRRRLGNFRALVSGDERRAESRNVIIPFSTPRRTLPKLAIDA